jgi:hypothetical protein
VNALANSNVGNYLNTHFVSSYQKVGTFRIVNCQKVGGNVASYFCTPDGEVLHIVVGAVNADTLLREARWTVDNWKLAQLESKEDPDGLKEFFRRAHTERFQHQVGMAVDPRRLVGLENQQSRVHLLLTLNPLVKIEQVYPLVFEKIVGEQVSTEPVDVVSDPRRNKGSARR